MKISGSIMAAEEDCFTYAKSLHFANADFLHIDIFDDGSGFEFEKLLEFDDSYLPLDVHLIYHTVSERDIDLLNRANVQFCNLQYETLEDDSEIIVAGRKLKGNFGIALTEKTPLSAIDRYINHISQVLIMCSEPGVSGAPFAGSNFERIRELKGRYPSLPVFADGGIDECIAEKMNQLGVDLVVSGSYLSKHADALPQKTYQLKYGNERHILVRRKMMKPFLLPLIHPDTSFFELMDVMNHYRLGCVFVTEEQDELIGMISDGDVRRAFIKYGKEVFDHTAGEITNRAPFTVSDSEDMEHVYQKLSKMHRGIDVVPVTRGRRLIGALDLHMGI